jgi:hypothetical protein
VIILVNSRLGFDPDHFPSKIAITYRKHLPIMRGGGYRRKGGGGIACKLGVESARVSWGDFDAAWPLFLASSQITFLAECVL